MRKNIIFKIILAVFLSIFILILFKNISFGFVNYLTANLLTALKITQEKKDSFLSKFNFFDNLKEKENIFEINLKSEEEKRRIAKNFYLPKDIENESFYQNYQNVSQGEKQSFPNLEEVQKQLNEAKTVVENLQKQIKKIEKPESTKEENKDKNEKDIQENEKKEVKEIRKDSEKKEDHFCPVDINTASIESLQVLNGIGPVLAERIVLLRPFYSLNDLLKVKGIGEKSLQKIIDQKCAYVDIHHEQSSGYQLSSPETKDENIDSNIDSGVGLNNSSSTYYSVLISEVQIEGESKYHDFIELYNPNDFYVNISNYKIRKRTSGGQEYSISIFPSESIIPAKGYYLWASSEDNNYPLSVRADIQTKNNISENNSIALLSHDNKIIDSLSWGESQNPFIEGASFVYDKLQKNQSIGRIVRVETNEYEDSGNNSLDFEIQQSTPKQRNQPLEKKEEPKQHQNVLSNEFFEDWNEPALNAEDLKFWTYSGNKNHIKRENDSLKGNFYLQWNPITSAQDLIQSGIKITENGNYYAQIWIKPVNVNEENYIRVAVNVTNSVKDGFKRAAFKDYKNETGWIKIEENIYLEQGEDIGFRIRALRVGSENSYFLIGAVWLGITPPPSGWFNSL